MNRMQISTLVLSASALVGLAVSEGYSDQAIITVPGDVPTLGFGSTAHADGAAVRMGDKTTPVRALVALLDHASRYERAVKRCAPVPMHPWEYEAYVRLTYNIGEGAFCRSTLASKLNAGDYAGACDQVLKWDRFNGKPLRGLTLRRQAEHAMCIGRTQATAAMAA